jgi:hypothetical protein
MSVNAPTAGSIGIDGPPMPAASMEPWISDPRLSRALGNDEIALLANPSIYYVRAGALLGTANLLSLARYLPI